MDCGPDAPRYDRHLPLIGREAQEKLSKSTALVVGLGGLGSIVTSYLAATGVGRLIIVDSDTVEESNLNRQLLYDTPSIGLPKPCIAARRLKALNPCVEVEPVHARIESVEQALKLAGEADIIVDALDNWRTRLILDEASTRTGKPLVHAAVERYYGQVYLSIPGKTQPLRAIAPQALERRRTLRVIGPVVGMVASLEALITIQALTGDTSNAGKLIIVDARTLEIQKIPLAPPGNTAKQ